MRALIVGVPAFLLASMTIAEANVAQSDPCAQNATGTACGRESLEQCTTTRAESGRCEQHSMGKPRSNQPLIAHEQSTPPPPPEGSDRKQSSMPQATRQQKMQTCEFGAKDQKLTGAARKTFMSKCLASDDAPGRKASPKPKAQQ
jgi:hypothetical protein